MTRQETISREEAVRTISRISGGSVSYAEDLYDSFFEKPVVPQYVADWYEEHKDEFEINLFRFIYIAADTYPDDKLGEFENWLIADDSDTLTTLVNMHQFGYEVEKKKLFKVRLKGTGQYLCNDETGPHFIHGFKTDFTKDSLVKLGFGWVFSCEGIEIEEVDDGND